MTMENEALPAHPEAAPSLKFEDLIERLEKAMEPDRELDAIIFCAAFHPNQKPSQNFFYKNRDEWGIFKSNQPASGTTFYDAPHYTASIDAALTLVPQDYRIEVHGLNQSWDVFLNDTRSDKRSRNTHGRSNTFPVALCIAALKARSATP